MTASSTGFTFTDQLARTVVLSAPPSTIVSVVPSQTELLFYLGLEKEIVGITKFCVHPAELCQAKTKVGGTRQLNIELIRQLEPDLIIANKEENDASQIKQLASEFAVWVSDVKTIEDAFDMIYQIGEITARTDAAQGLCRLIQSSFEKVIPFSPKVPVAYLIWRKPYMAAGSDTFINAMLQQFGFRNVFSDKARYPETTISELQALKPQCILLSSEPYPFSQSHVQEIQQAMPATRIVMVDGEIFSWYGSRLLNAAPYFIHLRSLLTSNESG
ncbi:MAG: helical backbone metal receptor [Chitinophagales bacterium]|nr:helical backbone metal receptor [Chitinophagales bacterium]